MFLFIYKNFCLKHDYYRYVCMFACYIAADPFLRNSVEALLLTSLLTGLFLLQAKLLVLPRTCLFLPLLDSAIFFSCYP